MTIDATVTPTNEILVVQAAERQGPLGYTGSRGDNGFVGSRGYTGSVGFTGSKGAGFTGSQGVSGFTGSRGYDGSKGPLGFTGSRGSTGFVGSSGDIGFTGSRGSIGLTGFVGSRGLIGALGYTGSHGFTGSQGTGFTGSRGPIGFTGSGGIGIGVVWQYLTSSYTAKNGDFLLVNTDSSAVTVTLPANPTVGDFVAITNKSTNITNPLIINRNNQTIDGLTDNLQIDVLDSKIELVFNGTTWEVISSVGSRGYTGSSGVGGSGGGGSSPLWIKVNSTYSINPFENVMVDSNPVPFSVHLPFNPAIGTSVSLCDVSASAGNTFTINRNGQTIENTPENLIVDLYAIKMDMIFDGVTWRIFVNSGIARLS